MRAELTLGGGMVMLGSVKRNPLRTTGLEDLKKGKCRPAKELFAFEAGYGVSR
jgi:hypothetical protein